MPKFKVRCTAEMINCFMVIEAPTMKAARDRAIEHDYDELQTERAEIGEIILPVGCPVERIEEDA